MLSDGAATYAPGISEQRGGTSKYYHGDALGSTGALTDSSQTSTDAITYDAFGNASHTSGTTPTPFLFAGGQAYQSDADSGLKLLGNRYYDSDSGRFLSQDPAQDGDNWYAYAGNNPLRHTDPTGLVPGPPPTGGSSGGVEAPQLTPQTAGFWAGKDGDGGCCGPPVPRRDMSKPPYDAPAGYVWVKTRAGLWFLRDIATGEMYHNGRGAKGGGEPASSGTKKDGPPDTDTPANGLPGKPNGKPTKVGPNTTGTIDRNSRGLPDGGRITTTGPDWSWTLQWTPSGWAIVFGRRY